MIFIVQSTRTRLSSATGSRTIWTKGTAHPLVQMRTAHVCIRTWRPPAGSGGPPTVSPLAVLGAAAGLAGGLEQRTMGQKGSAG